MVNLVQLHARPMLLRSQPRKSPPGRTIAGLGAQSIRLGEGIRRVRMDAAVCRPYSPASEFDARPREAMACSALADAGC